MSYDLVIKNGRIVDGTGAPPYIADVAVAGDRIARIGPTEAADGTLLIDAGGKYVVPGFIDPHSHADCSAFLYPDCESYLRQGITTFIGGQCGDSNAPIYTYWMRKYWEYDMWEDIDPFVYNPRTIQEVNRVIDVVQARTGHRIGWRSFAEYREVVEQVGIGCNMITLAGHSQIRADVMGFDQARPPSRDEMERIKGHVEEAMASGAWGISTGRDYPPSAYAAFDEICELAAYVERLGGCYFTHWRRTGPRIGTPKKPNKLEGIGEALEVALRTGVKTQISHLATGFEIYPEDPRMDACAAETTLAFIDEFVARGADAAFDVIPGTSGGIATHPYLASFLMPWVKQSGSLSHFARNLQARDYREMLVSILRRGEWYAINPIANPAWERKIFVTAGPGDCVGKSIGEIARLRARDPLETVMDLLAETPRIMVMKRDKSDAEIAGLLRHPRGFVCTDTYAFDLVGIYGHNGEFPELLPHPHTYCAFPKYILTYGMDTFEETIHKITGAPAAFLGIEGRGTIKEGHCADILVMDPDRLATNEDYIEPRRYPEGIDQVIVNGVVAVDPRGFTGKRPGRVLAR